jgi:hypothetical protein
MVAANLKIVNQHKVLSKNHDVKVEDNLSLIANTNP